MAYVMIKQINDDEYMGVEKVSDSRDNRTFVFEASNLLSVCNTLTSNGHNYTIIYEHKRDIPFLEFNLEKLYTRSFVLALFVGLVTILPAFCLEVIAVSTGSLIVTIFALSMRVVMLFALSCFAMLRVDTKRVEQDLGWSKYHKVNHIWIRAMKYVFAKKNKSLSKVDVVVTICMIVAMLIIAPIEALVLYSCFKGFSVLNLIILFIVSAVQTLCLAEALCPALGCAFISYVNKYLSMPLFQMY